MPSEPSSSSRGEVTYLELVNVPVVNAMKQPSGYTVPRVRRVYKRTLIERIKHWIAYH